MPPGKADMSFSHLVLALLIGTLPMLAMANDASDAPRGARDAPRWDREAYRVDRGQQPHRRWEQMSDQERDLLRRRKEQYESLPPSEQRRLRRAQEEFERMPPERRQEMRERWERMSPEEKERYRLERAIRKEMLRERHD